MEKKGEIFESKTQVDIWNREYFRNIYPNFFSNDDEY